MLRPLTGGRRRSATVAAAFVLLAIGAVAGCDTQEDADLDRGRLLFLDSCGGCHELTEAGTASGIGPSLDASFAAARASGMDQDTVEGVVESQIANPRLPREGDPDYDKVFMPANLVTGRDASDVAAYVASVAGVPGIEPPELGAPQEVFTQKCGSCHTLEAAATTGSAGPVLDELLPQRDEAHIEQSIREPDAEASPGFETGGMPPFDESQIPENKLTELIRYLLDAVSGGGQ